MCVCMDVKTFTNMLARKQTIQHTVLKSSCIIVEKNVLPFTVFGLDGRDNDSAMKIFFFCLLPSCLLPLV